MGIRPSRLGCSGSGAWNGGGLATTSLEFEFCLQFPCGFPSTELSDFHQSVGSRACKLQMYFWSLLLSLPAFMKMSPICMVWFCSLVSDLLGGVILYQCVGKFKLTCILVHISPISYSPCTLYNVAMLEPSTWAAMYIECWLKGCWPFVCLLSFHQYMISNDEGVLLRVLILGIQFDLLVVCILHLAWFLLVCSWGLPKGLLLLLDVEWSDSLQTFLG